MAIFFQYNWMHELLSKSLRTPQGVPGTRTPQDSLFIPQGILISSGTPYRLLKDKSFSSPGGLLEDSLSLGR
jgi:hypothetical protein